GNLFVVGFDTLFIVDVLTQTVTEAPDDPLFDWPSNIAFGTKTPYGRMNMYLANFGPGLGDGTRIVRVPPNDTGARLLRAGSWAHPLGALDELLDRHAALEPRNQLVGVEVDADRVLRERAAPEPRVQLRDRREVVDLELHLVPVGVAVVHRRRRAVVDRPVG